MSNIVISVENLSKSYRLGQIGTGTLSRDLEVWWAKVRGKPNPLLKIGQTDHGNQDGQTLWALQDVSFQVQQGEVLGIIGRNGAGKSTLLKILSRVTAPTSGQVKVKGRIASLLEVGTGFHPELTGRENIFLNGAILGMSKQEVQKKFDEIVSFAEVEKFVDTPVKRYSSGMYVRLAFAVAAHLESEILLVDEVLAVGDAEFQKKCLGKMGDVATNEGRTVFFVSHNMGSIKSLCNVGLFLNLGAVDFHGDINNCLNNYQNIGNNINDLPVLKFKEDKQKPIQLFSIKLTDESDEVKKYYSYKEPIQLKIEFLVYKPLSGVYFGAHIHDSSMSTLLFTRDFDYDEKKLSLREPGHYFYNLFIPAFLLAPGLYSISVHIAFSLPAKTIDGADHICYFEIIDDGSEKAKKGFPWRGKLSVPIIWEIKKNG